MPIITAGQQTKLKQNNLQTWLCAEVYCHEESLILTLFMFWMSEFITVYCGHHICIFNYPSLFFSVTEIKHICLMLEADTWNNKQTNNKIRSEEDGVDWNRSLHWFGENCDFLNTTYIHGLSYTTVKWLRMKYIQILNKVVTGNEDKCDKKLQFCFFVFFFEVKSHCVSKHKKIIIRPITYQ